MLGWDGLRDYEISAAKEALAHLAKGHSPLLASPTGSGKTTVARAVIGYLMENTRWKIMFTVHRVELLNQASKNLAAAGIQHGIIDPNQHIGNERIYVASIDTVKARLRKRNSGMEEFIGRMNLCIPDEAHHSCSAGWADVLLRFKRRFGLTATPYRLDGKGLGVYFNRPIVGPSIKDLVSMGYLSPVKVKAPERTAQLVGLKKRAGDYAQNEIQALMDTTDWNQEAVRAYGRWAPGVPAIAFCTGVEHAIHMAEAFSAAGWRAAAVYGTMDRRDETVAMLGEGDLDILTSCDLIGEGFDVPAVGCAIDGRPTMSTMLAVQHWGRCMRPHEDKDDSLVIDLVGNVDTHGMPDSEREWSLAGGIKGLERRVQATRRCPQCRTVHGFAEECPDCGYRYGQKYLTTPDRVIEMVGGFTVDQIKQMSNSSLERVVSRMKPFDGARVEDIRKHYYGWAQDIRRKYGF